MISTEFRWRINTLDCTHKQAVLSRARRAGRTGAALVQSAAARPVVAEAQGADLVLEDVKLFDDSTLVDGPAYSVRFRNQGVQPSGKFLVAVIAALDGTLSQDDPRVVMEVPALYPGEMRDLVVRLPVAALKMGPQRAEFSYLIVMVDATNTVSDTDEENNAAVLERAAL